MSQPIFDRNHDPLGDLTLKMTDDLEPEDDMTTPTIRNVDDNIEPNVASVEKEIIQEPEKKPMEAMFVTRKNKKVTIKEGVKEDKPSEDWVESITHDKPKKIRGERGKDKAPRKKRVMTPEALEKLKLAREKSLAKRRATAAAKKAKKEELRVAKAEAKIEARQAKKPQVNRVLQTIKEKEAPVNVFNDFDKFCSFMDRYDERKKKTHSTSRQPHPNKKMPERERPRPPVQAAPRNATFSQNGRRHNKSPPPGNFSPYSLLKSGRRSVFGNGGMNNSGGYNNGW